MIKRVSKDISQVLVFKKVTKSQSNVIEFLWILAKSTKVDCFWIKYSNPSNQLVCGVSRLNAEMTSIILFCFTEKWENILKIIFWYLTYQQSLKYDLHSFRFLFEFFVWTYYWRLGHFFKIVWTKEKTWNLIINAIRSYFKPDLFGLREWEWACAAIYMSEVICMYKSLQVITMLIFFWTSVGVKYWDGFTFWKP